jgi:hypothetical protein
MWDPAHCHGETEQPKVHFSLFFSRIKPEKRKLGTLFAFT